MKNRATIVQHSFDKHETITRNGHIEVMGLTEAWKEYELKFHGPIKHREGLIAGFQAWVLLESGDYVWNADTCSNEGECPKRFHCWCEAMEFYLTEVNQYKKVAVTNKLFAFEEITKK